jgi:hypothetical protein
MVLRIGVMTLSAAGVNGRPRLGEHGAEKVMAACASAG